MSKEIPLVNSNPLLCKKEMAGIIYLYSNGKNEEYRRQNNQPHKGKYYIKEPFYEPSIETHPVVAVPDSLKIASFSISILFVIVILNKDDLFAFKRILLVRGISIYRTSLIDDCHQKKKADYHKKDVKCYQVSTPLTNCLMISYKQRTVNHIKVPYVSFVSIFFFISDLPVTAFPNSTLPALSSTEEISEIGRNMSIFQTAESVNQPYQHFNPLFELTSSGLLNVGTASLKASLAFSSEPDAQASLRH